jgi:hypothetical protein
MPIDDPGWGDFTPPPAAQQPQQPQQQPQQPAPQTQPQPQAPPPTQGPSGPSPFADPKVRMVLGAIVVLALAAGAYFMFFAGDSEKEDDKTPAVAVDGDDQDEDDGGDVPEGGDIGTLPLSDYAEIANQVCTSYADDIQAASQAQDFQALAQVDQAMLDELMSIPPPDESADVVEGLYADFQLAVDAIAAGDVQSAQQYASTASATASQLGFDACAAT